MDENSSVCDPELTISLVRCAKIVEEIDGDIDTDKITKFCKMTASAPFLVFVHPCFVPSNTVLTQNFLTITPSTEDLQL